MSRFELRLLGGFDARLDGADLIGFESQKARALLAYLALNRGRQVERRFLSGLLWSERSEVSARRNLRQALHNIRGVFGRELDLPPIFGGARNSVQINPEFECWVDVESFLQSVKEGLDEDGGDLPALAAAARIYAGDLLSGFSVEGCPVFDDWLRETQDDLKRQVIGVYRKLVSDALDSLNYRLGIDYAHRLLTFDPASEETHRQLMRLYAASGRHSRALSQYKHLQQLLQSELGVEPMPETLALYEELVEARENGGTDSADDPPVGPVLPLEGRAPELRRLRAHWQEARDGHGSLTLLVGDDGIGKTRLARSFLAQVATEGEVSIRSASLRPPEGGTAHHGVRRLVDGPTEPGKATVLFIDDLQWSSEDDSEALLRLVQRIYGQPVWVLACCRSGADLSPLHRTEGTVQHLALDRLHARAIHAICNGLLNLADAQRLSRFLGSWSGGSPLAIAEMIHYLWDVDALVAEPNGGWTLGAELPRRPGDFESLIRRRVRLLPTSARRLLVLAALIGARFDRTSLVEAGDEHPAVVDACLEVLIDRWLIRWADAPWTRDRPGSDIERWNRGQRVGSFEFAHERVRWAVVSTLAPERARELRRQLKSGRPARSEDADSEAERSSGLTS